MKSKGEDRMRMRSVPLRDFAQSRLNQVLMSGVHELTIACSLGRYPASCSDQ